MTLYYSVAEAQATLLASEHAAEADRVAAAATLATQQEAANTAAATAAAQREALQTTLTETQSALEARTG
jgi:hypothetical protein